ncbi:MAG: sigma-70 family RNA polymerase sigma factor [Hamadaea sp.]|nr:sigma-70 family RNA polymerase sigma factor [Hamadaea sp.]
MSTQIFPPQTLLREVGGPDRRCQIASTPAADGRWEFSLLTADADGQVLTDLSGMIAPEDVGLILTALPVEVAALSAWGGPAATLAERRRKHPNLYAKWTEEEEQVLVDRFTEGEPFARIAKDLGRTVGGVKARLLHLGHITAEEAGRPVRRFRH